jgi:CPA1 family monovalent cation:H+ antiporter
LSDRFVEDSGQNVIIDQPVAVEGAGQQAMPSLSAGWHHGPVDTAWGITILGAAVIASTALARRLPLPSQLVLLVFGIAASFVPQIPDVVLTPDLVLLGLLPPLLYAAAIRSSVVDFKAQARSIGVLSIGMVVLTAAAVGAVVWWVLPVSFPVAFALGAVVAPPDAVSATSIARRVGLPRRVVTVLEGESLFNDATAITCLRVAVIAIAATVTIGHIALAFVVAAGGGLAIGLLVAWIATQVRRRIQYPPFDNALSLLLPFAAYLPAEQLSVGDLHGSGVIAAVTAGLITGHRSPVVQTAQSRLSERTNWTTIQFLLENAVFLLIGLQTHRILATVGTSSLGWPAITLVCLAAFAATILVRLAAVIAGRVFLLSRSQSGGSRWAETLIIGWAGMRGMVTLAAAFLLPRNTPYRSVLIFAAMVVTAGTLLLQGLTLPVLAQKSRLRGPTAREDALQSASVLQSASSVALQRLAEVSDPDTSEDVLQQIRDRINRRTNGIWERLGSHTDNETPADEYRRLRLETLQAERQEVLRIRDTGRVDHEVIETVLNSLDIEESMLTVLGQRSEEVAESEPLRVTRADDADCQHLRQAPADVAARGDGRCLDCLAEGTRPVHLRLCLTCGHVGCCDSSAGQHARRHWEHNRHPVLRSFEPGENWRWCFIDRRLG